MPHTNLFEYTVDYLSDEEYRRLKRELFTQNIYYFEFATDTPFIVDAGAHIGLSVLYFKHLYPECQILAIEPHPTSFVLLQKNVEQNRLTAVRTIQAALVKSQQSHIALFADGEETWLMSASLRKGAWNGFQEKMVSLTVPSTRLSQLIDRPVDLLKLDVEGGEHDVIIDLIQTDVIRFIQRICVEVHSHTGKDFEVFVDRLEKVGLYIEEPLNRKQIQSRQPELALLTFSRADTN